MKYIIVTPCYNEAENVTAYLKELEEVLGPTGEEFEIIVVDDASTDNTPQLLKNFSFTTQNLHLNAIRLLYNSGHQSAIRQGLMYIKELNRPFKSIIVMDCDGEDDPSAILKILNRKNYDIIFFERGKRHESLLFKLGYSLYKLLFKIVAGHNITYGNYSVISREVWKSIYGRKFFHYAAFLSKLKFKKEKIKADRRKRHKGKSKVGYQGLIFHGLKSFVEYSEELLLFFIKILIFVIIISLVFLVIVLYKKFISHAAILGWASTIGINLLILFMIITSFIVLSILISSIKNILTQPNEGIYEKLKE